MNEPADNWQKLVAAARKGRPPEPAPPPPKDFAHRVIGFKETISAISKVLFWRRWSLWVALLCVVAFLIIFLLMRATAPKAPLIEPPPPPPSPASSR
ncbi:MAG: hypothetical protein MUF04_05815 [Akkermansiaceae bacterium]|nr:hypothetical protein [Akkermansiaceae bacterium]